MQLLNRFTAVVSMPCRGAWGARRLDWSGSSSCVLLANVIPSSQVETPAASLADITEFLSLSLSLGGGRWVELVDVPLWALSAIFVFRIAAAFRGGSVGRGASWVGWALALVAVGKALRGGLQFVQADRLLTAEMGQLAWGLVLALAWALAGLGIYEFYRAGRSI